MAHSTTAIYENGAFHPIHPIKGIPEHTTVRLQVETITAPTKEDQLAQLAAIPVAKKLATSIEAGRKRKWPIEEF